MAKPIPAKAVVRRGAARPGIGGIRRDRLDHLDDGDTGTLLSRAGASQGRGERSGRAWRSR
jgi:hypothetical protein